MALGNIVRLLGAGALLFMGGKEHERRTQQRERTTEMIFAAKAEAAAAAKLNPTAPIGPATHTISPDSIKHSLPMEPELAEYMSVLPQAVQNIADATRMSAKLENNSKVGLWQNAIMRVINLIQPNEFIYAMTWNAHCVTTKRHSEDKLKNLQESHGVVFFSNRRFLFFKDPANIIEFPLNDIYTVDAHKGHYFDGISFRTTDLDVQLTFAGGIDRKLFRDMVIYIAANAACPSHFADAAGTDATSQICECPGCGATVIIHENVKSKCEYCNRFVEKQPATQAAPQAAAASSGITVADEIKKFNELMNKGLISKAEFEDIRAKLLSRL